MCDTMVALSNSTRDGSVLFAKNSDRQPNEPHVMIRVPRQKHDLSVEKNVKATYIEIPQAEETYEVILLKPSWIWGCEMGCNEFGLNIGNEAVFTKEKLGPGGLTGMDMARIALERCRASSEAVDMMTSLLETYGQGGNCGFEKHFEYHNSFLIADKTSAWVLETAGRYWVAKQVGDIYCISNRLTIGKDFDRCHADVVKNAIRHRWCRDEKDFDFAKNYSNPVFSHFSGARQRREACETALRKEKGNITADTMISILRSHHADMDGRLFQKASLKSVCMHAGGLVGDQTTGSYVASLKDDVCTYWVTGASAPCLSVFKPVWLRDSTPLFKESQLQSAIDYWRKRELLHRAVLGGLIDLPVYIRERDKTQQNIRELVKSLDTENAANKFSEVMRLSAQIEENFVERTINKNIGRDRIEGIRLNIRGNPYYRHYWRKQNAGLNTDN